MAFTERLKDSKQKNITKRCRMRHGQLVEWVEHIWKRPQKDYPVRCIVRIFLHK